MTPEHYPKCRTVRECKVWRHCHCGHDFEPDYVYERAASLPFTQPEPHYWTTWQYRTFYFCLLGFVAMGFVFDGFLKPYILSN